MPPAIKNTKTSVLVLNKQDLIEKPAGLTPLGELKTMGGFSNLRFEQEKPSVIKGLGFVLDAATPVEKNKAELIIPPNKDMNVNAAYPPYYYQFIQRTMLSASYGKTYQQGKVTLRFNDNYNIDNGVIFLRVGGNHGFFLIGGTGYFIKVGNAPARFVPITPTQPNEDGNYNWVSQTIPVVIYTPSNTRRKGKLPDIEITSDLPVWKFFSANYSPFLIKEK